MSTDRDVLASGGGAYPLAGWADKQLQAIRTIAVRHAKRANQLDLLSAETLLGERARLNRFEMPGLVSAGGGCRLWRCADDWVAVNLARADDVALLPALFEGKLASPEDHGAIRDQFARSFALPLVERGREMGMAMAAVHEPPAAPAIAPIFASQGPVTSRPPLVVDLASLWAGPLAGHLLWLTGATVIKVESTTRPDVMRHGDPGLFALLNQGKDNVAVDLASSHGRMALASLLARADIVIEATRPRALRQMGIDSNALIAQKPGKIWLSITGHGMSGPAAEWVGFGDDCAVAGGLARERLRVTGTPGFVGDAIADPLTGMAAARVAIEALQMHRSGRYAIAMSGVVAQAIRETRQHDAAGFDHMLQSAAARQGAAFPTMGQRTAEARVHALGEDNARWLPC